MKVIAYVLDEYGDGMDKTERFMEKYKVIKTLILIDSDAPAYLVSNVKLSKTDITKAVNAMKRGSKEFKKGVKILEW